MNLPKFCKDGPKILRSAVEYAIKGLKTNKITGPDDIYPEILRLIKDENLNLLTSVFNLIYETGEIPQNLHTTT